MQDPTPQVYNLHQALCARGVSATMDVPDGHKHVDIAVRNAKLYIEVDGMQHVTDADQIIADFERTHYSDLEGIRTLHITNNMIDTHLEEVADAIVKVVKKRTVGNNTV